MQMKIPLRVLFVIAAVFFFSHSAPSNAMTRGVAPVASSPCGGCGCYKSDVCIGRNAQYCLGRTVCMQNCTNAGYSLSACNYCCPLVNEGCGVCGLGADGGCGGDCGGPGGPIPCSDPSE